MNKKNRAVFLDRDGTINVEKNYVYRCEDFSFLPDVPMALKRFQDAGFLLVVVTNQSGVARGYYTLDDVDKLHEHMKQLLLQFGIVLSGIYVCPHLADGVKGGPFSLACDCRKGRPGMLLQAAEELNIELSKSYMIGDKLSDLEAGHLAGCKSILVTSVLYEGHTSFEIPDYCLSTVISLNAAANYILNAGTVF